MIKCLFFSIILFSVSLKGFDRSFFYRTSSFWGEPRFERTKLTTFEAQVSGGSTRLSKNPNKKTTSIFGLYGPDEFFCLTENGSNLTNNQQIKKFIFTGVFDLFEANFNFYQNFVCGFFVHFHLPVVSMQIFPNGCKEISSKKDDDFSNHFFCQSNFTKFKECFKDYIDLRPVTKRGLSDTTLFLGWTKNYEDTCYLDFIDFTFKAGILFPSGKKKNESFLFDIPLGYNGHWGIAWWTDVSIGAYEWLTVGLHTDGVAFISKHNLIAMRTSESSTGLIRLKKGCAKIDSGPVWRIGLWTKADHICWGLSFLMAFAYEQKNKTFVIPEQKDFFDINIVNKDQRFKSWSRWIYQFIFEYDFAYVGRFFNPRVALLYNHQIAGKRVFNTNILGGYFGCEVAWEI